MSDDEEMPPVGGEMGDDMSDNDDMDYSSMGASGSGLPEGVKKEVLKEGEGYKKPKKGDEVTVHYVGTLESDGSEFDSSRSRDKPFTFTLGQGQVIQGWDVGVASMKQGELAKFTLAPDYAYGESGSPPKIPGGATLIFEVELLSWVSKDDLFQDGGVIKSLLKEGSGWKKPKEGDEVRMTVKVFGKDGSVLQETADFDYILGSGVLGPIEKAVDKALTEMKKGEEASLACTSEYAGPDGEKIDLTLVQLYETKDVSFAKNKSLMKKQIVEGEGYDTPKDAAKVKLMVSDATNGTQQLSGFIAKALEFTVGNGEVCDALECAVAEMKLKEKAVLSCFDTLTSKEDKLGLKDVSCDKVVFTLELIEFEKAKDTWDMSEDEKIEFATARKDVGSALFKSARWRMALGRYKKIIDLFNYLDGIKDEAKKAKAKELKKLCELNSAACNLKLQEFSDAQKNCDNVLKEETSNVKALFRRAQAHLGNKNYVVSMADLKKLVEIDPQNREARALMKEAQAGQKEEDKKSKGLFAKMCQGLGKGPIPPPGKSKPEFEDEDEDMEDDGDKKDEEMAEEQDSKRSKTKEDNGDLAAPAGA
jgi:FK506-binding protein 4/5